MPLINMARGGGRVPAVEIDETPRRRLAGSTARSSSSRSPDHPRRRGPPTHRVARHRIISASAMTNARTHGAFRAIYQTPNLPSLVAMNQISASPRRFPAFSRGIGGTKLGLLWYMKTDDYCRATLYT